MLDERADVETALVVDPAAPVGHADDAATRAGRLPGGPRADVAEALHDDRQPDEVETVLAWRTPRGCRRRRDPVAGSRPGWPPRATGFPVTMPGV